MFKRLGNLIRGFFGLFVSGLEKKNPEALLEVEQENLRGQIAKYNKGLASHAALCEKLITQVKKLQKEEQELRAKTTAQLRAGNKRFAGQHALSLQTVTRELDSNREQLEDAEKTYKELTSARDTAVKAAKDKIQELKRDLSDMKMNQAMADLNEMASGMISEIGGSGDTLDRLHEMVTEEKEKAAGRNRVARDSIDTTDLQTKQQEQEAMEDLALADFAAMEGIAVEDLGGSEGASTESGESEKSLGS